MNNAALAKALSAAEPIDFTPQLRVVSSAPPAPLIVSPPPPPRAAPRGLLYTLWLRIFGPPAIDPRSSSLDVGVFRALYEVGSDYIPSSGTWPSTSDRS